MIIGTHSAGTCRCHASLPTTISIPCVRGSSSLGNDKSELCGSGVGIEVESGVELLISIDMLLFGICVGISRSIGPFVFDSDNVSSVAMISGEDLGVSNVSSSSCVSLAASGHVAEATSPSAIRIRNTILQNYGNYKKH